MIYIISNNDCGLPEYIEEFKDNISMKLIKGNIRDVAFEAREYLMDGYSLVADPVAGRLERPTPYLTIILKENKDTKKTISYEIMRVEYFVKVYNQYGEMLDTLSSKYKKDFGEIDKSLTKGCCMQALNGR